MYRDIILGYNRNCNKKNKIKQIQQPKSKVSNPFQILGKKILLRAFQHYPLEIASVNHFISEKAFY